MPTPAIVSVEMDHEGCTLTASDGAGVPVRCGDERIVVTADNPHRIAAVPA